MNYGVFKEINWCFGKNFIIKNKLLLGSSKFYNINNYHLMIVTGLP